MKKSHLLFIGTLTSLAIVVSSCTNTSKEALLDIAANLAIEKYQKSSCAEIAQMQPQSANSSQTEPGKQPELQKKAIEMLQQNPEMREKFINRVAGPIANKMFECNLIP